MLYKNPIPELPGDDTSGKGKKERNTSSEGYFMYDNIYFAFIDVLGFRQTFDENRKDPTKQFAKGYEDVFSYFSHLLQHTKFMRQGYSTLSKAGQTSDSLYFYTDRPDYLSEFIKIYLHFSLYAMSQNVFFRGGIAKGCLFVNEPYQFYGDCVIKAYLLEEKVARYPRIALDEMTYKALKDIPDLRKALKHEIKEGRYYLEPFFQVTRNELAAIMDLEVSQIQTVDKDMVLKHIREGKKRFEFDERNYPKYHFLDQMIKELGKLDEFFV